MFVWFVYLFVVVFFSIDYFHKKIRMLTRWSRLKMSRGYSITLMSKGLFVYLFIYLFIYMSSCLLTYLTRTPVLYTIRPRASQQTNKQINKETRKGTKQNRKQNPAHQPIPIPFYRYLHENTIVFQAHQLYHRCLNTNIRANKQTIKHTNQPTNVIDL